MNNTNDINELKKVASKNVLANIIMNILSNDTIDINDFKKSLKIGNTLSNELIKLLISSRIIYTDKENTSIYNVIDNYDSIPNFIIDILVDSGFTEEDIKSNFIKCDNINKIHISPILESTKFDWIDYSNQPAPLNTTIAVRAINPKHIMFSDRKSVLYAEDYILATYDGTNWNIIPPYCKFNNYDIISESHNKLNNNTIVTHWAYVDNNDIEKWKNRFEPIHTNIKMNITVEDKNREMEIYQALTSTLSILLEYYKHNQNIAFLNVYDIISDLSSQFSKVSE